MKQNFIPKDLVFNYTIRKYYGEHKKELILFKIMCASCEKQIEIWLQADGSAESYVNCDFNRDFGYCNC